MKIYFNGYPDYWVSPYKILEKVCFWHDWESSTYDEPWVKVCEKVLNPFCKTYQVVRNFIHPQIRYVKIDRYDTWSMDHTLAYIILPMLKQLRDTKHGSPMVDDEDVPEHLRVVKKPKRKKKGDVRDTLQVHALDMDDEHSTIHDKWDWTLNEMIWTFEQKVKDDDEMQFFDYSGTNNTLPWDKDYVRPKVDWDGLKAHQARKANGFKLFGKYYEGLWD